MRSAAVQGDKLNFDLGYEEKNANFRIHKKIQVFQFINPGPPSPPPICQFLLVDSSFPFLVLQKYGVLILASSFSGLCFHVLVFRSENPRLEVALNL